MNESPVSQDKLIAPISPERERTGKLLYKFAWGIEIFAVLIGLGIAVMQFTASFMEMNTEKGGGLGFSDYTNATIAAIPFLMVALVEITKIPFVDAFYMTTSRIWRLVFLLSLFFIAFITFESAANGFERNFTALNFGIERLTQELQSVDEYIPELESRRDRAAALTAEKIEADYDERYQTISSTRAEESQAVRERIRELRASIKSEYSDGLQEQIKQARQELSDLRRDSAREIDRVGESYDNRRKDSSDDQDLEIRQLTKDYEREQDVLEDIRRDAQTRLAKANIFNRAGIEKKSTEQLERQERVVAQARSRIDSARNRSDLNKLNREENEEKQRISSRYAPLISNLRSRISELTKDYNQSIGAREKDIEIQVESYDEELLVIEKKFASQIADNQATRTRELEQFARNAEVITGLDAQIDEKNNIRLALRADINDKVGDNQVYRMAKFWYSAKSAADLKNEQVRNVAVIWFGSLAMLVAFTGIILALASNVIRDPTKPNYVNRDTSGLSPQLYRMINSIRRFFIYRRRLQRKPVIKEVSREVVKEVAVEKVVKTEVPVEIVKRELVHVPFYTNDPKLLKMGQSSVDLND